MNEGNGISTFLLAQKSSKKGHWGFPRGTPQRVSHCVQNIAPNHTGQVRGTGRRRNCRTPYRRHDFAKQITAKRSRAAKFRELAYGSNNSNFACSYPKHPDGAAVAPSRGGFVGATFCVRAGHCFGAILYSTPPAALPLSPSPRGTPAPEKIFFQKGAFSMFCTQCKTRSGFPAGKPRLHFGADVLHEVRNSQWYSRREYPGFSAFFRV